VGLYSLHGGPSRTIPIITNCDSHHCDRTSYSPPTPRASNGHVTLVPSRPRCIAFRPTMQPAMARGPLPAGWPRALVLRFAVNRCERTVAAVGDTRLAVMNIHRLSAGDQSRGAVARYIVPGGDRCDICVLVVWLHSSARDRAIAIFGFFLCCLRASGRVRVCVCVRACVSSIGVCTLNRNCYAASCNSWFVLSDTRRVARSCSFFYAPKLKLVGCTVKVPIYTRRVWHFIISTRLVWFPRRSSMIRRHLLRDWGRLKSWSRKILPPTSFHNAFFISGRCHSQKSSRRVDVSVDTDRWRHRSCHVVSGFPIVDGR